MKNLKRLKLKQWKYIEQVLKHYNAAEYKSTKTSIATQVKH